MKQMIFSGDKIPDDLLFIPTIVFGFYPTDKAASFENTAETLRQRYEGVEILGSKSSGNMAGMAPYKTDEVVWCLLDLDREAFCVAFAPDERALEISDKWQKKTKSAFLFYAVYDHCIQRKLEVVSDVLNGGAFFGAIAGGSTDTNDEGSFYCNGQFYERGVLFCLIDADRYEIRGSSLHDFEPAGIELVVTQTDGYTVTHIEDEPALFMVEQIIGQMTSSRLEMFDSPFFVKERSAGAGSPYKTLASLVSIDRKNGTLTLSRILFPGDTLKVAIPASYSSVKQRFSRVQKDLQGSTDNGVMMVLSSSVMPAHWHDMETLHIMKMIENIKLPFLGMHTASEICPVNGERRSMLQNQTLSVVILREKEEVQDAAAE